MKLAAFRDNGQVQIGALSGRWMIDLRRACQSPSRGPLRQDLSSHLIDLFCTGDSLLAELDEIVHQIVLLLAEDVQDLIANGTIHPADEIQYLPPVQTPGKILCVGLNYPVPNMPSDRPAYPVIFGKFANTLIGHRQAILLPGASQQVACEGELALVIGRAGRHIPLEKALDHVAGVTLANDLTAIDLENRSSQWMTGKLPDTFTPLGPALVTLDEIPDLDDLILRTYRNGVLELSGRTGAMFFGARELINYLSGITTLEVGDLILTGSPKGIDDRPASRVIVNPGDEIVVEIESIGRLVNHALAEENDGK
jgi:2-keto-4-pentenoate hydratase/2-oxohepta-3-ene-1,7-dioic acid hydratase in catechol pathway